MSFRTQVDEGRWLFSGTSEEPELMWRDYKQSLEFKEKKLIKFERFGNEMFGPFYINSLSHLTWLQNGFLHGVG